MIPALTFQGFFLVLFTFLYIRWADLELAADICLLGLIVELVVSTILVQYVTSVDCIFYFHLGCLFTSSSFPSLSLVLVFDEISGFFLGILCFALIVCFFFLIEYFEYDSSAGSIVLLSSLFSQCALLYFCSYDLILLVFFWELLGLISFFLVQHWAYSLASYKAGLKVYLFSQFSDLFFFLFIFLLIGEFGVTDLSEISSQIVLLQFSYVSIGGIALHLPSLLGILVYLVFAVKAAQWFFYPWLLDAMEAPVPISAQLHSSTLVIVGFYLLFRFEFFFAFNPILCLFIMWGGVVTAICAAFLSFFQDDGKRLLAASTASQLGYVSVSFALGLRLESLLLLSFCCCGNAITFVWFGTIMRSYSGYSDFRIVGGLSALCWVEHIGIIISVCAFTVVPGVFGWHIKTLFSQGSNWCLSFPSMRIGLELLDVSWFFSCLYLWSLYINLFLSPSQVYMRSDFIESSRSYVQDTVESFLLVNSPMRYMFYNLYSLIASSSIFIFIMFFSSMCFVSWLSFFFLIYTDVFPTFLSSGSLLSYY